MKNVLGKESAQLSQLEVETKAAVSAVDERSYSRHEPTFSDDTILEDDIEQDFARVVDRVSTSRRSLTPILNR